MKGEKTEAVRLLPISDTVPSKAEKNEKPISPAIVIFLLTAIFL